MVAVAVWAYLPGTSTFCTVVENVVVPVIFVSRPNDRYVRRAGR